MSLTQEGPRQDNKSASANCSHCGLVVPPELRSDEGPQFCCAGCETVFQLLQDAGLEGYYDFREKLGEAGQPAQSGGVQNGEWDSPAYHELYCERPSEGVMKTELLLEGVHCAACVWLVERLPRVEPHVISARLDLERARVELLWDVEQRPLSAIANTLEQMGYRPRPVRGRNAEAMRTEELRKLLVRIGVAGASAGNVMLMAFALYSGEFGLEEAGTMAESTTQFFRLGSLVVSLPALWAGSLFFRGAWASLKTRTPHMDLPIALGILTGFLGGAWAALAGSGEIYFDSITALVFFLLVGRYLQRRHQMSVSDASELLHAVIPSWVTAIQPDSSEAKKTRLPIGEVREGMTLLVASGEVIPVDGEVRDGKSNVDRSLLSGESRPQSVGIGESVEAGAVNLSAPLQVTVRNSVHETRIAGLMEAVQQAVSTRTPLVARADRLAGVFTVAVIGLSLLTGVFWSLRAGALEINAALSLLIVACPCALGLATPLALSAATHQAARQKKLVFAPQALEVLGAPCTVVLDKTGTLTKGKLSVLSWEGSQEDASALLQLERGDSHPVARALVEYLESQLGAVALCPHLDERAQVPGSGIEARVDGEWLRIGKPSWVRGFAELPPLLEKSLEDRRAAASPLLVSRGAVVTAVIWLGDQVREDAVSSLLEMKRMGHRLELLSGDDEHTVLGFAQILSQHAGDEELFQRVEGGATPERKNEHIAKLTGGGHPVVMVGDGVNDSVALARADVGVAVSGAAEVSRLSADVYLADSGVLSLVEMMKGARRTLSVIRRGIGFSLAYNAIGITLSATGVLGPLGAAVLMPLSSLTVVSNAYKSRTFSTSQEES